MGTLGMTNALEEFKNALISHECSYIYRKYLLGHDVWYFRDRRKLVNHAHIYDDLKITMSEKLGIHINNIAIVGSAKLGFSITPKNSKMFRAFSDSSDIDIVVVSPELFRKSWSAYLEIKSKTFLKNYNKISNDIFRHFVSLKEVDISNDFFRDWSAKMDPCKRDLQTFYNIPAEVNYRIYESWEDVERYHLEGLDKLKKILMEGQP